MAYLCEAHQESDAMVCKRCELLWDVNDMHPPACKKVNPQLTGKQSRIESSIEIALNMTSGFLLSWAVYQWLVAPYVIGEGLDLAAEGFVITSIYTVISVARSYAWRRFFNADAHKLVHAACARFVRWGTDTKRVRETLTMWFKQAIKGRK